MSTSERLEEALRVVRAHVLVEETVLHERGGSEPKGPRAGLLLYPQSHEVSSYMRLAAKRAGVAVFLAQLDGREVWVIYPTEGISPLTPITEGALSLLEIYGFKAGIAYDEDEDE